MNLNRQYIVDENNRKIAVQLDMETFQKIENILENYALVQLMNVADEDENLHLEDAKNYYANLTKAK